MKRLLYKNDHNKYINRNNPDSKYLGIIAMNR